MAREPDATPDQIRAIGRRHPQHAAQARTAVPVSPRPAPRLPRQRIPRALRGLGIKGVSLHSYRYAWAERAKTAGYPERFAQLALGHNSKAVHRAYARKAQVTLPLLEDYEKNMTSAPVIPLPISTTG